MNIRDLIAKLEEVGYKSTPWTPNEIKRFKDQYEGKQLPKDFLDLITQLGYVVFNTTYNSNGQLKPTTEKLTLEVWETFGWYKEEGSEARPVEWVPVYSNHDSFFYYLDPKTNQVWLWHDEGDDSRVVGNTRVDLWTFLIDVIDRGVSEIKIHSK